MPIVPVSGVIDHDRRMRPVGGGDRGDEIGDAGAVLGDAHAVAAGDARIAVGHVAGALLVRDRNEADAGRREEVQRVHEGRAHDAEDVGDAVGDERFDEGFGGVIVWGPTSVGGGADEERGRVRSWECLRCLNKTERRFRKVRVESNVTAPNRPSTDKFYYSG